MLTQTDKSRLRGLLQSQEGAIIENLRKEYCAKLQANPKTRETMDETAITTIREEGKVEGITNLFQEIWNNVND